MKKKTFSLINKLKSFSYAFNGLKIFFRYEQNAKIHTLAAVLAVGISWWLNISNIEWVAVIGVIVLVFIAEIFNSSIEQLADAFTEEIKPEIKIVKDLAAGAVLLASILALIIALIIFLPKIISLF